MTTKINAYGMVKEGDRLGLFTSLGNFTDHAKVVVNPGTDNEEVVIHKGRNHYFILSMLFDKKSWVHEAHIIDKNHREPGFKYYRKGNVKNLE